MSIFIIWCSVVCFRFLFPQSFFWLTAALVSYFSTTFYWEASHKLTFTAALSHFVFTLRYVSYFTAFFLTQHNEFNLNATVVNILCPAALKYVWCVSSDVVQQIFHPSICIFNTSKTDRNKFQRFCLIPRTHTIDNRRLFWKIFLSEKKNLVMPLLTFCTTSIIDDRIKASHSSFYR